MAVRTPDQCMWGVDVGGLRGCRIFWSGYMTLFKHTNCELVEAEHVHDTNMSKSTPKEIRPLQHSMCVKLMYCNMMRPKKIG
jgi:hypothetical protein